MKHTPIRRTAAPKKVNRARKAREFARCFGSKERVAFVRSLKCVVPWCDVRGDCENAHVGTEGKGAGRKANADQIAPLCRAHHRALHQHGQIWAYSGAHELVLGEAFYRGAAAETEALWQAHGDK